MRLRFTIRDLLLSFVVIALAMGWWIDHLHIARLEATKWEYDYNWFDSDPNQIGKTMLKFNKLGEGGWQICGMEPPINDQQHTRIVYFQRPK